MIQSNLTASRKKKKSNNKKKRDIHINHID